HQPFKQDVSPIERNEQLWIMTTATQRQRNLDGPSDTGNPEFPILRTQDSWRKTFLTESQRLNRDQQISIKNKLYQYSEDTLCQGLEKFIGERCIGSPGEGCSNSSRQTRNERGKL
ncbi:hypothetical protein H8959_006641, partial [Pygathrix nigripes]